MCGLLGTFNLPAIDVSTSLDKIRHRGPDGSGIASLGPATHGHVRLALLDLSDASAQPFRYRDSLLSFNGEIWNYKEVRHGLEQSHGITFTTSGDTEVLAAALYHYGIDAALAKIDGMFVFAYSCANTHILARDRFGEIPLYVHLDRKGFAWCSERKGLAPLPCAALPPAMLLDMATGKLKRYYDIETANPYDVASPYRVADLIETGVAKRLNADALLCCLVSGGLDSSVILSIAKTYRKDVIAYTAVLDDNSADLAASRRLCDKMEVPLNEVRIRPPTTDDLARAVFTIELPTKTQVEIAALCIPLAKAIAADGFKAALSGEAADELFGGYGNMCIKGASASDQSWRDIRLAQLDKMSHGNFIRCNKAFMAAGVELRLPYIERALVETVIHASKQQCPPGKGLLKQAARTIVPDWVIRRPKATFQREAGMAKLAAETIANPARFYRAEAAREFGKFL